MGQHLSNSLCLLTCEQDRQRTATALSRLCFVILSMSDQTFHVLGMKHMMCPHMMHIMLMCYSLIMYDALNLMYCDMLQCILDYEAIPWRHLKCCFCCISSRENLPGHFKFKEYCPRVFHDLRKRFGMDDLEYMVRNVRVWSVLNGSHRND